MDPIDLNSVHYFTIRALIFLMRRIAVCSAVLDLARKTSAANLQGNTHDTSAPNLQSFKCQFSSGKQSSVKIIIKKNVFTHQPRCSSGNASLVPHWSLFTGLQLWHAGAAVPCRQIISEGWVHRDLGSGATGAPGGDVRLFGAAASS